MGWRKEKNCHCRESNPVFQQVTRTYKTELDQDYVHRRDFYVAREFIGKL
jgi:hypothetical protein